MQAGPHLDAEIAHALGDRTGAANPSRRPIKRGEEAVARRVELRASVTQQQPAHGRVVVLEQLAPARVAELHGLGRRADDVGEQDRREHAVDLGLGAGLLVPHAQEELFERSSVGLPVGCGDRMVGAGQLDVPRSRDVLGKMGRSLTDERVLCVAVEHERRHPNRR